MKMFFVLFALCVEATVSFAGVVEFAAPFADGCVLQRGVSVPVWGRADPGEKVEVTFGGQSIGTTAGADGTDGDSNGTCVLQSFPRVQPSE